MKAKFILRPSIFEQSKKEILSSGAFTVTSFRYETGVEALEVTNGLLTYVILPYQGQQIWRLMVDGEDFTMRSMFDIPEDTCNVFDESYGAFLIHCGLTAMGNPSEEDPHPMHGELPHARYQNVYIEAGEDEEGSYIDVGGSYCFKISIDTSYLFSPRLRLYEGCKILRMHCEIDNLRKTGFDYMYMAHINWLPINGSRMVYSVPKDSEHIEVFDGDFGDMLDEHEVKRLEEYTKLLRTDFSVGDILDFETQCYNPELCSSLRYKADEEGWAHAMQVRPDGTACYVGFETGILNNALRWFCWTGDESSCGFALPNTGNHMGRAYAIEHGLRKRLPGKAHAELNFNFGKLDKDDAEKVEEHINKVLN